MGYKNSEMRDALSKYAEDDDTSNIYIPKYGSNKIRTSKFNWINFLPLGILVQFKRWYNFYFLSSLILQFIPQANTVPLSIAWMPLAFIFATSLLREFIEEIRRKRHDNRVNNSITLSLKGQKFHKTKWSKLRVGDIILVHEDEDIPADLLLLQSSDHYGT